MPVGNDLGKSRSTIIPGISGAEDAVPYTSVSSTTLTFAVNKNSKTILIKTTKDIPGVVLGNKSIFQYD